MRLVFALVDTDGEWAAESEQTPGLVVTGDTPEDVADLLVPAVASRVRRPCVLVSLEYAAGAGTAVVSTDPPVQF
jgi:hypothetical protein